MDACEKVVRANPMYITKTYVRIAARCVCIDKLKSKKVAQYHVRPFFEDPEDHNLEESLVGNVEDPMADMEIMIRASMDPMQQKIYAGLLAGKMYIDIAESLKISLRTLERQIQELKWLCEYLLIGIDPDTNKHSLLL